MEANQLTAEELAAIRAFAKSSADYLRNYHKKEDDIGSELDPDDAVTLCDFFEDEVPRLLATVEAALLSIEDQAAIIADRDATVEALRAENERLKTALREVRTAFDDYQGSEGCECCEKSDHAIHAKTMARLMKEPEA